MEKSGSGARIYSTGILSLLASLILQANAHGAEPGWTVPRTEYGHPDLQGLWTNSTQTPFLRPRELGTRQAYTEEEALALEREAREAEARRALPSDPNRAAPPAGGFISQQSDENFDIAPIGLVRIDGEYRTSIVIDPPDGRLPPRLDFKDVFERWRDLGFGPSDGPEMRSIQDRCLAPLVQLPLLYTFGAVNAADGDNPSRNIQIVQNENYVVILWEYFSAVRIVRLAENHLDNFGRKWRGDSIARYDGDSLVVHTRNFRPEQTNPFLRASDRLEITETYTPVSPNELVFRFTISDPVAYPQPITGEISLQRMPPGHKLYEFACHEGNYSFASILRAARMEDAGLLQ